MKRAHKKAQFLQNQSLLFATVTAHVITEDDYLLEKGFSDNDSQTLSQDKFYKPLARTEDKHHPCDHLKSANILDSNQELFSEILSEMLQEVFSSNTEQLRQTLHTLLHKNEPSPFFCQLLPTPSHTVERKIPPEHTTEKRLFQSDVVQELFVEGVLEETIYNLINEISFGDFDVFSQPKLVEMNGDLSKQQSLNVTTKSPSKHVTFSS